MSLSTADRFPRGLSIFCALLIFGFLSVRSATAQFGASVGIDGDRIVVGEPNSARVLGEASFVFQRDADDGLWYEAARVEHSPRTLGSYFGYSTFIAGERAFVTNIFEQTVSVFRLDAGAWIPDGVIHPVAPLPESSVSWGTAIAASDDLVFVGQRRANGNSGAVYVYRRIGPVWDQEAIIVSPDPLGGAQFGRSLAFNGTDLFVGEYFRNVGGSIEGAAYAFRNTGGSTWDVISTLSPNINASCVFGLTLDVSTDAAIVSATGGSCAGGQYYFYEFDTDLGAWVETDVKSVDDDAEIVRYETGFGGAFTGIDGEYAAIPAQATSGDDVVVIFKRDAPGGSWSKTFTIELSPGANVRSLALGESRLVIGESGSAEVFARTEGSEEWLREANLGGTQAPTPITGAEISCVAGYADIFPCEDVNLLSFLPNESIGDSFVRGINDIWGWVDPNDGHEYALIGQYDRTLFVDVTDPVNPIYLGHLLLTDGAHGNSWRDIKVYKDHAFIVADNAGQHGMQVFDLHNLRNHAGPPVEFSAALNYDAFASAHNVVINEVSGYAYVVGAGAGGETCGGGLHIINIQDPENPQFESCFQDVATGRSNTGYTHDAQCVMYTGPDADYQGREICFGSNETAISIADVTDKSAPSKISSAAYPMVAYSHQGWLTEDQQYFLLGDELDESTFGNNTRTLIWDVRDLDDPIYVDSYLGPSKAITHNIYTLNNRAYLANYAEGLRILDVSDMTNVNQVAFFDTVPGGDDTGFEGMWSSYPYFPSGNIIVSSRHQGLFVLRLVSESGVGIEKSRDDASDGGLPREFAIRQNYPNPFNPTTSIEFDVPQTAAVRLIVYDVSGREIMTLVDGVLPAGRHFARFDASRFPSGTYLYRLFTPTGTISRSMTLVK